VGGCSGLGFSTSRALAASGARVAALDLKPGAADPDILPTACDVADESSVVAALDAAAQSLGPARIFINCAGFPGSMRLVGRDSAVDMQRFAQVIAINLLGTVSVMTKAAARIMAMEPLAPDGERGVIINTS
jgi:NAD(P)-dependent dehydrogenase (short-subunit alcohol dehydrogenase family)